MRSGREEGDRAGREMQSENAYEDFVMEASIGKKEKAREGMIEQVFLDRRS